MHLSTFITTLATASIALYGFSNAQGILPGTTGAKQAHQMIQQAVAIPSGNYALYNPSSKKYLIYSNKKGNDIYMGTIPQAKKQNAKYVWIFRKHETKFTSIHIYQNAQQSCLSGAFTPKYKNGKITSAVLYRCRYDKQKKRSLDIESNNSLKSKRDLDIVDLSQDTDLEKRSIPSYVKFEFFEGKQVWLFIPVKGQANAYRIYTAGHYNDMTKRCMSNGRTNYYGTDALVMTTKCTGPNTIWVLQRRK